MIDMAELGENSSPPSDAACFYLVHTAKPEPGLEEDHHFETLSTLLGSDEAARDSLMYVYKDTANAFVAELTTAQAEELKGKPGVLQVTPCQNLHLHVGLEAQKQF